MWNSLKIHYLGNKLGICSTLLCLQQTPCGKKKNRNFIYLTMTSHWEAEPLPPPVHVTNQIIVNSNFRLKSCFYHIAYQYSKGSILLIFLFGKKRDEEIFLQNRASSYSSITHYKNRVKIEAFVPYHNYKNWPYVTYGCIHKFWKY